MQVIIAGRPVTPKRMPLILDGTAHTDVHDHGLRLTKSQEQSGVIAAVCFLAFFLGCAVLGIGQLLGAW